MEYTYLSPQWRDEAEKRLKAELTPEKMNNITTSVSYNYRNCPDGNDRYLFLSTADGQVDQVLADVGQGPKAEFEISGSYAVFARITKGEIKSQKALMTGKLKVKGNMAKALKLAALADRINKILAGIPAQY